MNEVVWGATVGNIQKNGSMDVIVKIMRICPITQGEIWEVHSEYTKHVKNTCEAANYIKTLDSLINLK